MLRLALLVFVAVVVLPPAPVQEPPPSDAPKGQTVEGGELVDYDYRFKLRKVANDWALLDEVTVARIVPDAVAGQRSIDGRVWSVIVVEQGLDVAAAEYADLVLGDVPLEDLEIVEREDLILRGDKAHRVTFEGRFESTWVRYVSTFLVREGFAYQLASWGIRERAERADLVRPHDALSFLEGRPTGRVDSEDATQRSAHGNGWRLEQGRFRSSVYRLQVDPPEGWRVVVGDELTEMNADAAVGLTHRSADAYLVLIPETMAGVDQDAAAQSVRDAVAENLSEGATETKTLAVGDEDRAFDIYRANVGFDGEFLHTTWFAGDTLIQALAWYAVANRDEAQPKVVEALRTIRALSDQEAAGLDAELAQLDRVDDWQTSTESLRNGRYVNYELLVEWQAPESGYWEVDIGQQVRQELGEDWLLSFDELASGLSGALRFEEMEDYTPAEYHRVSVEVLAEALGVTDLPEPMPVRSGYGEGLVSHLPAWRDDPIGATASIATWMQGTTGIEMQFYGSQANLEAARKLMSEASLGLRALPESTRPLELDGRRAESHLFGFAVEAPKGFGELEVSTPIAVEGRGLVLEATGPEGSIGALAVAFGIDRIDEKYFAAMIQPIAKQYVPDLENVEENCSIVDMAGRPGRGCLYRVDDQVLGLYLLIRGRTGYGMFVTGKSEEALDAARRSFALID